jgi:hypothetical protein
MAEEVYDDNACHRAAWEMSELAVYEMSKVWHI